MKMAPGRGFSLFKSQNFKKTGQSFVVMGADPNRRTVSGVLDERTNEIRPFANAVADVLKTTPAGVMPKMQRYSFGIEVGADLFVRSVADINADTGVISFFCDVNSGDRLELLEATDFVEQTRRDLQAFLQGKPPAIGAVLNDCILRRLNNESALRNMSGLWPMPVAGFSTFGELFGININQTLTAVVFFDTRSQQLRDPFADMFPIHYAHFASYFTRSHLNRMILLNRIKDGIVTRLTEYLGTSAMLSQKVENALGQTAAINTIVKDIHSVILTSADSAIKATDTTALAPERRAAVSPWWRARSRSWPRTRAPAYRGRMPRSAAWKPRSRPWARTSRRPAGNWFRRGRATAGSSRRSSRCSPSSRRSRPFSPSL
jgi:hypothetical protein